MTMNQRKRSSDYPMLPFEYVWRRIAEALSPLPPVHERLVLVFGVVLADDILAQDSMPPPVRQIRLG